MKHRELTVRTGSVRGLFDITGECASFVSGEGDGLLNVFVPHATAGVVIMELGAGSDIDLVHQLDELLPRDDRWRHAHGSRGHGADHVLPLLVSASVSVAVIGGELQLGTWQSVAILDPNSDNATRRVALTFLKG
ncbi:MAG TPA: secondary thiamine-phosphate synthase enzyme YjbQ [Candidatus Limnocylindrales bacterium]|nr:secondary thiamine-phosphate synthase enzyme YjbQ [Candidatus Limnocylindrales bacterium]